MTLKTKASKINFTSLPGSVAPEGAPDQSSPVSPVDRRPKTAPGVMMAFAADQRSELLEENQALKAKVGELGDQAGKADALRGQLVEALDELKGWDGAKATRLIDPKIVVRSQFANRHQLSFQGAEFAQLKHEIADAGGNVQPVKVRPVANAGEGADAAKYELVFGHRRHQACMELGLPLLAVVDNLDDRALFVEMDRENRAREDLSPWEQGVMYRRALDLGLFPSNRKLAEAVGVDLTNLGKALALATLPEDVLTAFSSPLELQYRWATPLKDAISSDFDGVRARGRELSKVTPKLPAKDVFQRLVRAKGEGGSTVLPPSSIDIQVAGKRAATVRMTGKGGATVTIEPGMLANGKAKALVEVLEKFFAAGKRSN